MIKLLDLFKVFKVGVALEGAIKLKQVQLYAGYITALLGAILVTARAFGYDLPLSDEQLVSLGGIIATFIGMFNTGATAASTTKIGISGKVQSISETIIQKNTQPAEQPDEPISLG